MRRLVIDGVTWLWKVEHAHVDGRCHEVFTAYLEGHKASPVRITFVERDGWHAGYPASGVIWSDGGAEINLNLPSSARRVIELARRAGWSPETARSATELDGVSRLLPDLS